MSTLWLGPLTPMSSSQTTVKMDASPFSKENKCIVQVFARALTAGQHGAIFIYGRCTDSSDGLGESETHFCAFLPPLPPPSSSPAFYDLGLGFLVCNPSAMLPVSVLSLSSLPPVDSVSGAFIPSHHIFAPSTSPTCFGPHLCSLFLSLLRLCSLRPTSLRS